MKITIETEVAASLKDVWDAWVITSPSGILPSMSGVAPGRKLT
jgi:hypothetical protein